LIKFFKKDLKLAKEEGIMSEGVVVDAMPNAIFRVKLDTTNTEVIATICGKIRINNIHISVNDRVIVELSPYDLKKGRIMKRL